MAVYAIADLHLSHAVDKPMDVFGPRWENHTERIRENWMNTVGPEDTVVIPGDLSWGMDISEAEEDLLFVEGLPGRKILLKGNHDYWWMTMNKLRECTERLGLRTVSFLFNNAYEAEDFVICGTRGWLLDNLPSPHDEQIMLREAGRLRRSVEAGEVLLRDHPEKEMILFLHYPPAYGLQRNPPVLDAVRDSPATQIFYGHMHNADPERLVPQIAGIPSRLVAADWLEFQPMRILPTGADGGKRNEKRTEEPSGKNETED